MNYIDYSRLQEAIRGVTGGPAFTAFVDRVLRPDLGTLWGDRYAHDSAGANIVEVQLGSFAYLFDLTQARAIAAYGFMQGHNKTKRDSGRMAGFPKHEGREYHRGHMIPHTGHGGTDINLFIQLGSVNVGPFRDLEKQAVAAPGSFYFVNLLYAPRGDAQRPIAMEQGLATQGSRSRLQVHTFTN
jgi:hypothetical protein